MHLWRRIHKQPGIRALQRRKILSTRLHKNGRNCGSVFWVVYNFGMVHIHSLDDGILQTWRWFLKIKVENYHTWWNKTNHILSKHIKIRKKERKNLGATTHDSIFPWAPNIQRSVCFCVQVCVWCSVCRPACERACVLRIKILEHLLHVLHRSLKIAGTTLLI